MPETITLKTNDNITLAADLYAPTSANGRGAVLLLHMMPATKESWKEFALALATAGYFALAPDFRGHGQSTEDGKLDYHQFNDEEQQAKIKDVEAAVRYLKAMPEIDPANITIVGASIGANLALNFAANDPTIKQVVLLSPGLDYHGVRTLEGAQRYNARPLYLAASDNDPGSIGDADVLFAAAPTTQKVCRKLEYAGHGTTMLADANFKNELLAWIKQ